MSELSKPLTIVGLGITTTNNEAVNNFTIAKLWEVFLKTPVKEKLANINSPSIFCVYSDYENKTHGKYNVTIGYAVDSINNIPSEFAMVTIPAGKYREYPCNSMNPADIFAAWQAVWATDPKLLKRSFLADFEEYQENKVSVNIGEEV